MSKKLDWEKFGEEALAKLKSGGKLEGKDGVMAPMIKHLLEAALDAELDNHLEEEKASGNSNRRNGKSKKGLKTDYGKIALETGRDRSSSFEPELIKKRQTTLGEDLDNKIISMYSRGMSYSDIQEHLLDLYGLSLSKGHLTNITDKVWDQISEWQNRPLEAVYPIIWMDAIHFKVKHEGYIQSRAVYIVLGINKYGQKDLLALHLSENEGAKFWLQVLTDLQNRGVQDILIACIDNLSGFSEAITSIYPKTEVQLCIVHQIRNSLRYITSEDQKPFLKDLKRVYQVSKKQTAVKNLDALEEKWGNKYPVVVKSWRSNWEQLTAYFKYSAPIRKVIYTTNTVEGFNRQIRKVTKSKGAFPSEDALLKLVWLASQNAIKKWTAALSNWALAAQQFYIHFPDRFELDLNMGKD